MRKIFRLGLSLLATILLFLLCGCENTPTEIGTSTSEAITTASSSTVPSAFVTDNSAIVTVKVSEQKVDDFEELEKIEELPETGNDTLFPIRYQNGIEICTQNSNFQISEDLLSQLNSIYKTYSGTSIAWGLYSLEDDSYISYNKDSEFSSCSTIKVVYSLYCLEQVKLGKYSLDDILVYDRSNHHYNSKTASSSTIAKLGRTNFTLKEVIYYALYVSDNDAYMLLQSTFGFEGFNAYMETLGSTTSLSASLKYGYASVSNRAIEWKQIYSFYNESNEVSEFFKQTLLDAEYGYIEEGLSSLGYNTAHKSGWSNKYGAAHDCAIVYSTDGEYLMIILTQKYNEKPKKELVKKLAPTLNQVWSDYSSSN